MTGNNTQPNLQTGGQGNQPTGGIFGIKQGDKPAENNPTQTSNPLFGGQNKGTTDANKPNLFGNNNPASTTNTNTQNTQNPVSQSNGIFGATNTANNPPGQQSNTGSNLFNNVNKPATTSTTNTNTTGNNLFNNANNTGNSTNLIGGQNANHNTSANQSNLF
jgi:hypothetical protein